MFNHAKLPEIEYVLSVLVPFAITYLCECAYLLHLQHKYRVTQKKRSPKIEKLPKFYLD